MVGLEYFTVEIAEKRAALKQRLNAATFGRAEPSDLDDALDSLNLEITELASSSVRTISRN